MFLKEYCYETATEYFEYSEYSILNILLILLYNVLKTLKGGICLTVHLLIKPQKCCPVCKCNHCKCHKL